MAGFLLILSEWGDSNSRPSRRWAGHAASCITTFSLVNKKRNPMAGFLLILSEWGDSNSRPLDPQSSTLPTAPHPVLLLKSSAKVVIFLNRKSFG